MWQGNKEGMKRFYDLFRHRPCSCKKWNGWVEVCDNCMARDEEEPRGSL